MKPAKVDYSGFRLSRLTDPRFSHLLLLSGWIAYFALYFLTENLISYDRCHVIHCALDDAIPFCEWFVLAYTFWFLLVAGSLLFYLIYSVDSFRRLSIFIMITQAVAMICYVIYPSIQLLRPETMPRDNFLTRVITFLYAFDTPTGVCPSLHVAYSVGIASVWCKQTWVKTGWKVGMIGLVIVIIFSTFFIKQHSVVDAIAAIPVCILAEAVVFGKYWMNKLRGKSSASDAEKEITK